MSANEYIGRLEGKLLRDYSFMLEYSEITVWFDLLQRGLDDTNVGVNNQSLLLKLSQAHGSDATKVISVAISVLHNRQPSAK